jgi:glutathione synthase/RimK-type ligase-like ATP-grasp enzyme
VHEGVPFAACPPHEGFLWKKNGTGVHASDGVRRMSNSPVIGVVRDDRPKGYAPRWASAVEQRGGTVRWLDLLGRNPLRQAAGCDGIMWHWPHYPQEIRLAALPLLRSIEEHLHVPVFPDMATCWHYDDKIAQSYLLEALGVPMPETWVFWRKADALDWCRTATYPLVAKLSGGASSQNVRLIRDASDARAYVEECFSGSGILSRPLLPTDPGKRLVRMFKNAAKRVGPAIAYVTANRYPAFPSQSFWMPQKNYALFQEFLAGNEYDTRVTVIGNRAFAYRRFNRPNDFRASGSGNFDVDPSGIDLRCVSTAFAAARKLGSQSMAFDFLVRGPAREPVIGEISYCFVNWMVEKCPGHWDSDLNRHEGRLWPEEAHVEDFLQRVRQSAERA